MSASLVGSEMCIRDRTVHGAEERRRRPQAGDVREDVRVAPYGVPRTMGCLLYTSDAADDM
eukprot:9637237-Alexandrium_andersonii.AAC.1